jgi:ABC-type phosphate/phosphonate transport system substrate-binding protein
MDTKDEVVETLENDEYDYIQFKNKSHTDTDARLIATTALVQVDRQIDRDIYLFISSDVIAYTSSPVKYRQEKIDGEYELIEVSDAVDMLNKGDSL